MVLIWDGYEFREVAEKEAKQLVKEDKAQAVEGLEGTQYKTRSEFTGYRAQASGSDYETKVSKPVKKNSRPKNGSRKK